MISAKCNLLIDLNIIQNNYRALQKMCPTAVVGAAVKANCYGLGAKHISPSLYTAGCRHFFVANMDEAVEVQEALKANDARIYILHGYFPADKEQYTARRFIPVINCLEQWSLWQEFVTQMNTKLPCLLHVDIGMNRLGMLPDEAVKLSADKTAGASILCIMSHLSSGENKDDRVNREQLTKFKEIAALFPNAKKSLANSSGIFLGADYHFDMTRPGISIYGVDFDKTLKTTINNPITLTAPIIQLKVLNSGEYIGYNQTYQVQNTSVIATLPLGYADGYMRALSNKGVVFINNQPAKVVGRVSMDLINIDVTSVRNKDLFLGKQVEIIGPNMGVEEIAHLAGTSPYEILTMLGNRYNRVYKRQFRISNLS